MCVYMLWLENSSARFTNIIKLNELLNKVNPLFKMNIVNKYE